MLFSGCCQVRDAPEVWVWNLISRLLLSFTPYFSLSTFAQILRAARNFAISSKKSIVELKKKLSRGANSSTLSPASSPSSTYPNPSASVNASSWVALDPASRM